MFVTNAGRGCRGWDPRAPRARSRERVTPDVQSRRLLDQLHFSQSLERLHSHSIALVVAPDHRDIERRTPAPGESRPRLAPAGAGGRVRELVSSRRTACRQPRWSLDVPSEDGMARILVID